MDGVEGGGVDELGEVGVGLAEDAAEAGACCVRACGADELVGVDHLREGLGALLDVGVLCRHRVRGLAALLALAGDAVLLVDA